MKRRYEGTSAIPTQTDNIPLVRPSCAVESCACADALALHVCPPWTAYPHRPHPHRRPLHCHGRSWSRPSLSKARIPQSPYRPLPSPWRLVPCAATQSDFHTEVHSHRHPNAVAKDRGEGEGRKGEQKNKCITKERTRLNQIAMQYWHGTTY